jgi:hypothetical protein
VWLGFGTEMISHINYNYKLIANKNNFTKLWQCRFGWNYCLLECWRQSHRHRGLLSLDWRRMLNRTWMSFIGPVTIYSGFKFQQRNKQRNGDGKYWDGRWRIFDMLCLYERIRRTPQNTEMSPLFAHHLPYVLGGNYFI